MTDQNGISILLSIHKEHADRIFSGTKQYELRKALPKAFDRVFLVETGGGGVVGCFDNGGVESGRLDDLWSRVGPRAATEERFRRYFAKSTVGFAIRVEKPIRFAPAIRIETLREIRRFVVPQTFIVVDQRSALELLLEGQREAELRRTPSLQLEKIRPENEDLYGELVTLEVGRNYDDITRNFANQALATQERGYDPLAFLTRSKEVLEIRDERKSLVGFTTLTYKVGGAVKTGPTILLAGYRGRGFGAVARATIEAYAQCHDARQLYCTCPDNAWSVIRYLLRAGFRVRAHLKAHYSEDHGEFALGKDLSSVPNKKTERQAVSQRFRNIRSFLKAHISREIVPISEEDARRISEPEAKKLSSAGYEKKPREILVRRKKQYISAVTILIPKRGGAVKSVILAEAKSASLLDKLVVEAESLAAGQKKRKIYYVHRGDDLRFIAALRRAGYSIEGLLTSPYVPGIDHLIASKWLGGGT